MADGVSWKESAACRGQDPRLFFSFDTVHAARDVCFGCPVSDECGEYRLEVESLFGVGALGVWAGVNWVNRGRGLNHRVAVVSHR